jgi:hypothetical protein
VTAHHGHLPGSPARNGLPERRGYTYRGTGHDQLTRDLTPARLRLDITAAEGILYTGYDSALSEVPGASGRKPGDRR